MKMNGEKNPKNYTERIRHASRFMNTFRLDDDGRVDFIFTGCASDFSITL